MSSSGGSVEPVTPTAVVLGSPSSGNLITGVARKVRDNCAELHNCVQRWNALQLDGSQKLRNILDSCERRDVTTTTIRTFSPHLQELCTDLLNTVQQMRVIHNKMTVLADQFDGLVALADVQSNFEHLRSPQRATDSSAVFHTWTLDDFARTSRSVVDSYALDLRLKGEIVESVGHVVKPTTVGIFLLSAWLHQPHVGDQMAVQLEAMIVECRLRQ